MTVDTIKARLRSVASIHRDQVRQLESELLAELTRRWDGDAQLQKEISRAECSPDAYQFSEDGGIESWTRINFEVPEDEVDLLNSYLGERGSFSEEYGSILKFWIGDDNYIVKRGNGRDSGVWQGPHLIFDAEECSRDGEWDDSTAAYLIEKRMEKEGCFPGTFTADYHGNIFPFDTQKHSKNYVAPVETEESETDQ